MPQRYYRALDLGKRTLYGWEKNKDVMRLLSIVTGVATGNRIPPVAVLRAANERGNYVLPTFLQISSNHWRYRQPDRYGGHHRAIAHYILDTPLRTVVLPGELLSCGRTDIGDIRLTNLGEWPGSFYRGTSLEPHPELVEALAGESGSGLCSAKDLRIFFRENSLSDLF